MSIQTYRYKLVGPSESVLQNLVPGAAVAGTISDMDVIDIQLDSSMKDDLDAVMLSFGYTFSATDPVTPLPTSLHWQKFTKTYADLASAALTNDIELFQLPSATCIHSVVIRQSVSFSGGLIVGYTLSVGITGNLTKYAAAFNVLQTPGDQVFQLSSIVGLENFGAATSIRLAAVSVGAFLNAATQGSVDIWVLTSSLP